MKCIYCKKTIPKDYQGSIGYSEDGSFHATCLPQTLTNLVNIQLSLNPRRSHLKEGQDV